MSMLDTFFNKSFKGAKCKTLLKLTIPRIKLLRNRREIQLKQMRRDIAKLLENGQEATACIRVEHIIREENMMAAQEILELFCELVAVRLPIIEIQRECPLDLKEAISSICFAAPRCSDLPELQQIQMLFAAKYGREFVAAATELMPNCGVNRQIIELLSVRAPSVEAKMKLLKEIAIEHELDWDPAESEAELLKPHEDLLNGPSHLLGGSTLPLPKEKHVDSLSSNPVEDSHEESDLDADFDSLDLPEVPKVSVQQSHHIPSAPKITPPLQSFPPLDSGLDHEDLKSTPMDDVSHVYSAEHDVNNPEASTTTPPYAPSNVLADASENKQFVPFISSPPSLPTSYPLKQKEPASFSSTLVSQSSSEPAPSLSQCKTEANVDLQDVLDAARSAAEIAERAAAAARAAASLAQVRISELFTKANNKTSESNGKEVREDGIKRSEVHERGVEEQNLSRHTSHIPDDVPKWGPNSRTISSHNMHIMEPMSPGSKQQGSVHQAAHQPQRSTSLEDDPYFSYPNLFTSQNSSSKAL